MSSAGTRHGPDPSLRYRVRLELRNPESVEEYWAVTAFGELKAVAMATLRGAQEHGDLWLTRIEIMSVEADFEVDPNRDLLDYWEVA